jgi:hypothetical protein
MELIFAGGRLTLTFIALQGVAQKYIDGQPVSRAGGWTALGFLTTGNCTYPPTYPICIQPALD